MVGAGPTELHRFDGVRFERIDSVGGTYLLGEDITALKAPESGGPWIGYQYGGASVIEGSSIKNDPFERGLPLGMVESLAAVSMAPTGPVGHTKYPRLPLA